ncbi:MAG: hypothetical protein PUI40_11120 [Oscillospiraceae bacterium]|jgi:hypothetical protein|nr:hypothetical protein [Oscillospiraceae bacterium]MDD7042483.1 hypothetical protein [Oscillospiraceae bacterium]MDY2611360.1 hypothetical protein [Oscillospiraceae bacterium]
MKPRLRLCIYITIMLLFLTGCGEKIIRAPQVPMQVKQPFQTAVSIQYGDLNTEAILSKETDQNFRLEFQAPEVLQGMVLLFDLDQITIEYRDLIGSYQPDAIPQAAVGKLLVEAVIQFCQGEDIEVSFNGAMLEAKGNLKEKGDAFILTMDANTGYLSALSIPNKDFEATFSEITSS